MSATVFRSPHRTLLIAAGLACLAVLAASCQAQRPLADRAPTAVPVQGPARWNRKDVQAIASGELVAGAVSGTRLTYAGPAPITVEIYRMGSNSSAFESVQKWRTTPGKSVAYRDDLFLVFMYSQPDLVREFATPFLAALK